MSPESAERLWNAALGRLQVQTPKPTFDTWLAGSSGSRIDDEGHLIVSMPSAFAADWVEQQLQTLIDAAVSSVARRPMSVSYIVGTEPRVPVPAQAAPEAPAVSAPTLANPLRADFTFDRYIVGPSNQLAFAAAQAVARDPGSAFNPLFFYGSVGLGKTHLMHAIGLQTSLAGLPTLYVSAEQFTTDYLSALRSKRMEEFRERFRTLRVLLVDDIQSLAGKPSTQNFFFDIFNALVDNGGQLVLSSDRPAGELSQLSPRLRSRFEAGLQADISPPDYETRIALLDSFAEQAGLSLPRQGVELLANRITDSVRPLLGYFTRLAALSQFSGTPVTIDLVVESLGPQTSSTTHALTPETIIRTVALARGVPLSSLTGRGRSKAVSSARQLAMHLLHTELRLTPEEIGSLMGKRDRTTVLYSLRRAGEAVAASATMAQEVEILRASLTTEQDSPLISTSA